MANNNMIELRPYQQRGINDIRNQFHGGKKRVCYVAPCCSGKTVLMAYMASTAAQRGNKTLFVVHRVELLEQASRTLEALGVAHGIIAPGYEQTDELVQIASVQTLARREIPTPTLIIFDECHHTTAKTWRAVLDRFPNALVVGLTATPERLGGEGLGDIFEALVIGPSVADLIDAGNLADYKYLAPDVVADLNGLRVKRGDFEQSEAASRMDKPQIIGDAIKHYQQHAAGMQAICYCASVEHSQHTAEAFTAAGIPAQHVDAKTPAAERKAIMARFRAGEIRILTNVELFGEGVDIPSMQAVILLRPTASLALFIQQSMRGMRPQEGKKAVIIDHVDNVNRHGFPDDPRVWTLDSKAKRKRNETTTIRVRQCPSCYAAHRPAHVCPCCGFEYPIGSREVEQAEGELVVMSQSAKRRQAQKRVSELLEFCRRRGRTLKQMLYHPTEEEKIILLGLNLEELKIIGRMCCYGKRWPRLYATDWGIAI